MITGYNKTVVKQIQKWTFSFKATTTMLPGHVKKHHSHIHTNTSTYKTPTKCPTHTITFLYKSCTTYPEWVTLNDTSAGKLTRCSRACDYRTKRNYTVSIEEYCMADQQDIWKDIITSAKFKITNKSRAKPCKQSGYIQIDKNCYRITIMVNRKPQAV